MENVDLRRLLTDYNFNGHPLRKDYPLIGYEVKTYSTIKKTIDSSGKLVF